MQSQLLPVKSSSEFPAYFEVPGAHLYTVLHEVEQPIARVLLVGPFASERHNSYMTWVRWARFLAARNIEVLRFDYRGVGEGTGNFSEMTFDDWTEDVRMLSRWLNARAPSLPLMLHGLELGAVLASREFQTGVGDALLLWSPPTSANQAMRSTLLRTASLQHLFKRGNERKTAADFIRQLESGSSVEVDGYQWPARLWAESFDVKLPVTLVEDLRADVFCQKPVGVVKLGKEIEPLDRCGFAAADAEAELDRLRAELAGKCGNNFSWPQSFKFWSEYRPYFDWLFMDNYKWIAASLGLAAREQ